MKNKKKMIILVIQLFALIAFVLSYKSYTDSVVKPVRVYQFARTIAEGTKIEQKDIVVAEVAQNTYSTDMILESDISSIIGKYTTTKVFEGNICYAAQFGDLNQSNSMFASLDLTNARLMALSVDMSDVGGYLEPGDRIDLMFTANGEANIINLGGSGDSSSDESSDATDNSGNDESSESFIYSKIFLQDVIIYEVLNSSGFKYVQRADRYSGEVATNIDASDPTTVDDGSMATIIIVVSPEEAEEIKTRDTAGDITVLKRFDESETHDTLGYIIGNYGKIFSGHANAETSSLQIISVIQDTDTNDDVLDTGNSDDLLTSGTNGNSNNSSNNNSSNSTGGNSSSDSGDTSTGLLGGEGVE